MDDDKLRKMLMDPSVTIDDIIAEQLADDFRKATGIAVPERDEIAHQFVAHVAKVTDKMMTGGRPTVRQFPQ